MRLGNARPAELGQEDAAGGLVLDPREHAAQDAERRGHDAAALPTVDALGQDLRGDVTTRLPRSEVVSHSRS